MHQDESAVSFWQALKDRRKVAANAFGIVLLLACAVAFVTKQYSATAVVALDPAAATEPDGQSQSAVELAWTLLTDKQIAQMIQQLQLDTELTRLRAQGQVFTYLRSNLTLNEIVPPGRSSPEIEITYTGESETKAIEMANAVAQSLARNRKISSGVHPHRTPDVSNELARARSNLQLLEQSQQSTTTQADLQKRLKVSAELKAAFAGITGNLEALERESERNLAAASKPTRTPAPKIQPNPERLALEQEIREEQGHLNALRERYTEQYPDIQEAREALAQLQARLDRIPPDKPQPAPAVSTVSAASAATERRILEERDQLEAIAHEIQHKLHENERQTEILRNRLANERALAQDYAWEQQHYNALLQQQQASHYGGPEMQQLAGSGSSTASSSVFFIVGSATNSVPLGLFAKPVFWIGSFAAALFSAIFAVFLAEQFAPLDEEAPSESLRIS